MTAFALAGLAAIHDDLQAVFDRVTDDEWQLDSACTGWRVQDVLAHFTSNFNLMVNPQPPADPPPPPMTAEEAMEALVAPRKDWSVGQLLDEYAASKDGAFAALGAMQDEPMASMVIPIADLGSYPMHFLANAYCFDHYCHLRHDLLAPGGPLRYDVPAADELRLRPGIDWMLAGLAQMSGEPLAAVLDRPLVLRLTGPGGGSFTLVPASDGAGVQVVEAGGEGAATATSSAHDFVSWGTNRSPWRSAVGLSGDEAYGVAVLDRVRII